MSTSRAHALRNRLVDSPTSLAATFRRRRWDQLLAAFPDLESMSVIDLGGRASTWLDAPRHPRHVHVLNLEPPEETPTPAWMTVQYGNACALPADVLARDYDLVFSNSVLEHVGGHANRADFAASVHRLADRHWIQTPYRYFPLEPHWLFPWFQHLPVSVRAWIARRWPMAHSPASSREDAVQRGMSVSEHGIKDTETDEVTKCATEHEVYKHLGYAYIEPELREGRGELKAARDGKLPKLVEVGASERELQSPGEDL